jgi:hypothetical protein
VRRSSGSAKTPAGWSPAALDTRARRFRQRSISFSWIELNWSRAGFTSSSQYHCTTAASSSAVGVSALYSSILGGEAPS